MKDEDTEILIVMLPTFFSALAFGIWQKSGFAGLFMFLLIIVFILVLEKD